MKLIFEASLQEGTFPSCWKKANVVPGHKKEDKSLLKKSRSISLLAIFTEHINSKIRKCDELIGVTKKLCISFPRNALLRICKSFVRTHLDYVDMINQTMRRLKTK